MSEPAPKRRRLRPAVAEPDVEMEEPIGESASAPPVSAPPVSAPTAGEDSDSSDSDSESDTSSSSASSVSESSSEEEMDPALMEELPEDANKETEAAKKQRHLELARSAQLRRNDLMALLGDLPPEEAEKAIQNAFVVVKTDENQTALAEVVGVEPSAPYNCRHPEHPKEVKRLVVQLRCKRGVSEKFIKASAISSTSIEESHIQQWSKVMARCRIDPELVLDRLKDRAEQISRNKHIDYTEDTVKDILAQKKKIEFDAQKQSRMACNVQIGLTQMDISSIKEFEMAQLAKDHKAAEEHLHKMEKKEYEAQEHWFETRRDLYGVKEINRMNVERQKRDDAHALKYALEHEEQEQTKINPFERRACRPVSAWDTSLTFVEELEEMKRQRLAREARAKQAQEAKAQAKVVKVAEEAGNVKEGMEKTEKMEKMASSAEGNIGNIECLKGSKGKDGEEDELDELDKMINAAREQTEQNQRENGEDDDAEMASQLKASHWISQLSAMVSPTGPRNLYDVMGVAKDASTSGIRAAYRKLAVQLHPDKGGDPEAFAEMQAAYQILCSVALRQRYDETGKTDVPEDVRKGRRYYEDSAAHVPTPPKEELRCWKCNLELGASAKFCQECGAPREAPAKPKETASQKAVKVQLPPALQAMMEGRTLECLPVPEEYEQAVAHLTVTEKEGKRTLRLVDTYPFIDNSRLIEGQVLVQMRAVPLTMSDLNAENRYSCGDVYGTQGIGQVRMVGPRVKNLKPGDWVLPLHDVDADGEVDLDAMPPGTGRVLGVWKADRCAKLEFSADSPLTMANMALAKSIGAACLLVKEHTIKLAPGDPVVLNCANGLIGQVLIQLLAARGFLVYAVVRKHSGEDWIKQKLHGLGAAHVFLSSEDIRGRLEELERALPQLALDGVGGAATNQLVQALAKTGDLVCFGVAGGSNQQAVTLATGKKWKGSLLQFSFDEWLNRDVATNSRILNDMLLEVTELVKQKKMQFVIKEYTTERFNMAVLNAKQIGRTHAVVLHLPRLQENPSRNAEGQALAVPETSLEKDHVSRHNRSWDLDFLQWEDTNADEEIEWRIQKEKNLFQKVPHPAGAIQKFVEAPPTAIAQELGCSAEKAEAVLFWLPGRGEIPQEHAHWLETLCVNRELRVLILEPHQLEQDLKWYDMTDNDAVQLGLRFSIVDDDLKNPCGELSRSRGVASFDIPLLPSEIDAVQQVEAAALGLKRRAQLEEERIKGASRSSTLPFFFGGFGQGGVVALYAALCLMDKPIDAVAFCHSGIPAASMLGKRLTQQVRTHTRLHAIYDKADEEVPISFPETIHQMFSLARCKVSLYWLQNGDGHEFLTEASDTVRRCAAHWLDERQKRPDFML